MNNNLYNIARTLTVAAAVSAGNSELAYSDTITPVVDNETKTAQSQGHYLGTLAVSPLQAETVLPTTAAIKDCIDKTEVYSFTEYTIGRKSLGMTVVSKAPAECAAITEIPITLQANRSTGKTRGGVLRTNFVSKPVDVIGIQTNGTANIASDDEKRRRTVKHTRLIVRQALTSSTARRHGMVTKYQVVPRSPSAIDPANGAIVTSPVGKPKVETTRANPWLIIPRGAKRSAAKPWRIINEGKYMDDCNLMSGLSRAVNLQDNSKYMRSQLILGPHNDQSLDRFVIKFKNAQLCKRGGWLYDNNETNYYGFRASKYTKKWAVYEGGYLHNGREVEQLVFTGLVNGTKPRKFAIESK